MEWMPIETAPTDGTWILVAVNFDVWDDYPFCGVCQYAGDRWQLLVEESRDKSYDTSFGRPTHWTPLPPPPKA